MPLNLSVVQVRNGRKKNTELGLHGSQHSNDVVGVGFINERVRKLLRCDAQLRVAFIAEKVDVSGDLCADLVHPGLAVQFDIEALDVSNLPDVIEERLVV